jgi:hypothetical protein
MKQCLAILIELHVKQYNIIILNINKKLCGWKEIEHLINCSLMKLKKNKKQEYVCVKTICLVNPVVNTSSIYFYTHSMLKS